MAEKPALPAPAPYVLHEPLLQVMPAVVDVPHAGRCYDSGFMESSRLPPQTLRRSEDAYVDILFRDTVALGVPLLCAEFPRAYLDVNREPYELDQRMFEDRLPGFANTRSLRVAGGLGTIPRSVGDGYDIYDRKLPVSEALHRIETCYRPYHAALRQLIERTLSSFSTCVLVDAHSMPSAGLEREIAGGCDIVLGDRYGTSAASAVMDIAEHAFRASGFSVARNRPYAGGFITEHYGDPCQSIHALQIEINRGLYMDEATLEPQSGFGAIQASITQTMATCFAAWADTLILRRDAAE